MNEDGDHQESVQDNEFGPRLDQIETRWSLLRRAHDSTINSGSEARNVLVMRYSPAIRSYVKAIVKNDEQADELSQDVVVRILKGDFAGADQDRGRFRDLLKVAVRNMVRNHWDKSNRRRTVDLEVENAEQGEHDPENDPWLEGWRNNLLDITWSRLQSQGSMYHQVLKIRAEHPQADSAQLAELVSAQVGKEVNAAAVRQQLRRARLRFAEIMVEEIADGIDDPSPDRVQQELISLGLFENIKDVLPDSWKPES